MRRAPYQVLVFLHKRVGGQDRYLVLKRADLHVWQGIAGGGEDDETPEEAAIRETLEETGVSVGEIRRLANVAMIPVMEVVGAYLWGDDVEKIPEYAFVADIDADDEIVLGREHEDSRWCELEEAMQLVEWESNRTALKEIGCAWPEFEASRPALFPAGGKSVEQGL